MNHINIRRAGIEDCSIILAFIKELAIYEKLEDQVTVTEEDLKISLFERKQAVVLLLEVDEKPAGFALFFENYSTFLGKANIYLEDLYVRPEYRGKGYGKHLFSAVAEIALERGCKRLDWACLNWNQSSIDFYNKLGATALTEWTTFRLGQKEMESLVKAQANDL